MRQSVGQLNPAEICKAPSTTAVKGFSTWMAQFSTFHVMAGDAHR
jgi:hypothetical protein